MADRCAGKIDPLVLIEVYAQHGFILPQRLKTCPTVCRSIDSASLPTSMFASFDSRPVTTDSLAIGTGSPRRMVTGRRGPHAPDRLAVARRLLFLARFLGDEEAGEEAVAFGSLSAAMDLARKALMVVRRPRLRRTSPWQPRIVGGPDQHGAIAGQHDHGGAWRTEVDEHFSAPARPAAGVNAI